MAVAKKIKRAPAKRGRPAKAKTAVRRGRPPAKPEKVTRLGAALIAHDEAQIELYQAQKAYEKAIAKLLKVQERLKFHQDRETAKKELIPTLQSVRAAA